MNPLVDAYISQSQSWQPEMTTLRSLLLECGLTEDFKWRVPCYTHNGKNVVLIGKFKEYCTLSFLKGVLIKDTNNILVLPGEHSQSVKMAKFTSIQEIQNITTTLKAYIFEAIEIEKAGLKIPATKSKILDYPDELVAKMEADSNFKTAFEKLTPGRQRGYNMFFTAAKQSKTRITRIEKYEDRILKGFGINDCVCGHSKRMPGCDGSHKYL